MIYLESSTHESSLDLVSPELQLYIMLQTILFTRSEKVELGRVFRLLKLLITEDNSCKAISPFILQDKLHIAVAFIRSCKSPFESLKPNNADAHHRQTQHHTTT